ncbi:MAG: M23 family metallopeptidase [Chloroflexi bacterium]|nr:MAG: M23 family metallopeptidase [Chloroflexota bacterium]
MSSPFTSGAQVARGGPSQDSGVQPNRNGGRRLRRLARASVLAGTLVLTVAATTSAYWPVGSRSSWVTQWFSRAHPAIDIAANYGTRVFPARSGTVVFAGWRSNCGGYQVWVSNGNGYYTGYYHLARVYSRRGDHVWAQRSTIGLVGRSGCASGPHTHVELWHGYPWRSGSYRINPWSWIDYGYYFPSRYQ